LNTKIILEMGCNHQGKMKLAKRMISSAFILGVWCVKFQKRDVKSIPENIRIKKRNMSNSFGKTYEEHRNVLEFNIKEIKELKRYAESLGLEFMISVFDLVSAVNMVRAGIKYIKLPSQLYTSKLVKFLYNKKLRRELIIVLSTGMHTLDQVFKNGNYNYADIIFYCRSIYPCVMNEVNFKGFIEMKSKINEVANNISVGYSSHDVRGEAIPHMVLLGASHIERHYTLSKKMKGSDHKTVSSDFEEVETIIKGIKDAEDMKAHYDLSRDLLEKEQIIRKKFIEDFKIDEECEADPYNTKMDCIRKIGYNKNNVEENDDKEREEI